MGDRAYKVKKPLDLGFLDFRTRKQREAVCHREVELNRRLAPDVPRIGAEPIAWHGGRNSATTDPFRLETHDVVRSPGAHG